MCASGDLNDCDTLEPFPATTRMPAVLLNSRANTNKMKMAINAPEVEIVMTSRVLEVAWGLPWDVQTMTGEPLSKGDGPVSAPLDS